MSEDMYATYLIFNYAKNLSFLDKELYNYTYGEGLSTNKIKLSFERFQNICTTLDAISGIFTFLRDNQQLAQQQNIAVKLLKKGFSSILYYLQLCAPQEQAACINYFINTLKSFFIENKDIQNCLASSFDQLFKSDISKSTIFKNLMLRFIN